MPPGVSVGDGFGIAAATGRLRTFDFSWDLTNPYTFWSGTIAALFLFCSYFGTDQSQVQRYLTARSVDEARHSLLMSAYWKIPLQMLVLVLGVLVFVFYVFNTPPMLFNEVQTERMQTGPAAASLCRAPDRSSMLRLRRGRRAAAASLASRAPFGRSGEPRLRSAGGHAAARRRAPIDAAKAATLVRETSGDRNFSDANHIIPTFILTRLPVGLSAC